MLDVTARPLREQDLPAADQIMRLAFGTFLGLPDPTSFGGDAACVRARWRADPDAAFAADVGGALAGSNFAEHWGSVGFFGPLSVHPTLWDRGVGKRLVEPVMECFSRWKTVHAGLFTFADSQKHLGLYQRFGFWPRFLTAIVSKTVGQVSPALEWTRFSEVPGGERQAILNACRQLTDEIYDGLDVSGEIETVAAQKLGETLLLWGEAALAGFAVCHCGPGTEAGSGTCYVKFGAVRPGQTPERDFNRLLTACEELAAVSGLSHLVAGVNAARHEAYRVMLERGFRTDRQGVAMHRPNDPGYSRSGVYVIDDWR